MRSLLLSVGMVLLMFTSVVGQEVVKIYDIPQWTGIEEGLNRSVHSSLLLKTSGVVTLKCVDGYYVQDAEGDNDVLTNDAMFVADTLFSSQIAVGDALELVGHAAVNRSELRFVPSEMPQVLARKQVVNATSVVFPDDFTNYSQYVGMTLTFNQTLVVTSNYNWKRYGQLTLSSERLMTPTQVALPASAAYNSVVAKNMADQLLLDDGSDALYPSPLLFADADGTRRTGSKVKNLTAVLKNSSYGYQVVATATPQFFGNERPDTVANLGAYSLKVCAFNLCYFLASDYGTGFGPADASEAAKQFNKILDACLAIDADIFGFVEVQTGQGALQKLCDGLNTATNSNRYAYVNDGTTTNGSYTKVGYVYRQDKVTADKSVQNLNTSTSNRKKAQGFTQKSNGESFIFVLAHYKAKSGTGTGANADQGDGQGIYNATRVAEAEATVQFIEQCKTYYGYDDVLMMGDLNAYAQEDPLQILYKGGYASQLERFVGDSAYSYIYKAQMGCLDHVLANRTMAAQITGAQPFHINTDEPAFLEYSQTYVNNMYRSSDHDPVVCGLSLGQYNDSVLPLYGDKIVLFPNPASDNVDVINAENYRVRLMDYSGTILYDEYITDEHWNISLQSLGLPQGIYLMQFTENKALAPKRVVLKLMVL